VLTNSFLLIIAYSPSWSIGNLDEIFKKWLQNMKNCLPVKETRNSSRGGSCVSQVVAVFAIYLFKFYFRKIVLAASLATL
jgi:hypothetical protein